MKTENNLWADVIDFENLYVTYKEASKGKRYLRASLKFAQNLEENIITIQNELIWKEWRPRPLREFTIHEPKKRLISAPDFRDRVVHHALVRVIEPVFDKAFISDSHACRKGHGVQRAALRVQHFTRSAQSRGAFWTYKGDIKKFFPSVSHDVIKRIVRRKISDSDVLWLIDLLIDGYTDGNRGIPIGALTSQLLANVLLDQLDHFAKETLKIKRYARYMDDFVVVSNDLEELRRQRIRIEYFIETKLDLEINPKSGIIRGSIPFCGYRIHPVCILPRKTTMKRARRRLKKLSKLYNEGQIELPRVRASIFSYLGYAKHCSMHRTTESALSELILTRRSKDD